MHLITVVGKLLTDPEVRYFPSGTSVVRLFVLAKQRWITPLGEVHTSTTRFRILAYGDAIKEIALKLRKGDSVFVQGRLISPFPASSGNNSTYELVADFIVRIRSAVYSHVFHVGNRCPHDSCFNDSWLVEQPAAVSPPEKSPQA